MTSTAADPLPSWNDGPAKQGILAFVAKVTSEREYAYDAKTKSTGKLVEAIKEAPKRGWLVVDMKQEWCTDGLRRVMGAVELSAKRR